LIIGLDRRALQRTLRVGAVIAAVVAATLIIALIGGSREVTPTSVAEAVFGGLAIGMVLPAAAAVTALVRIELNAATVRQLVAGYAIAERPAATIREVRVVRAVFPVVMTFADGARFRSLGIPGDMIYEVQAKLQEICPDAIVHEE